MNLQELFLGQIPDAIYFVLFMILVKQLKTKRLIFSIITIIDYVILAYLFPYSVWSHILFFICTYINLKVLYKERTQVTDVFTLGIASLILIILNLALYFVIQLFTTHYITYVIVERIILFTLLFTFRNKLPNIQKLYKKLWNRNDKIKKKMKSTTFRGLNLVIFNFMFYMIHVGIAYLIFTYKIGGV